MVIIGGVDEKKVTTVHLHNCEMQTPWLKWGNQKLLRCMKENSTAADQVSASYHHRTSLEASDSEAHKTLVDNDGTRCLKLRLSIKKSNNNNGIDAVREIVMLKDGDNEDDDEEKKPSAEAERPWNLRTRRAACNLPPMETGNLMKSTRLRLGSVGGGEKEEEGAKFTVSLSRKEIEEDYMEILGKKPPRRPKKRQRNVQKQIDALSPGFWLTEITPDKYELYEFPESGKKIMKKDENPDEARLEFPKELIERQEPVEYDFKGGAGATSEIKHGVNKVEIKYLEGTVS